MVDKDKLMGALDEPALPQTPEELVAFRDEARRNYIPNPAAMPPTDAEPEADRWRLIWHLAAFFSRYREFNAWLPPIWVMALIDGATIMAGAYIGYLIGRAS